MGASDAPARRRRGEAAPAGTGRAYLGVRVFTPAGFGVRLLTASKS